MHFKRVPTLCLLLLAVATTTVAQDRVLHFPPDRSLGKLKLLNEQDEENPRGWGGGRKWSWGFEYAADLGEARGDVQVPADARVGLIVSGTDCPDLSPLANLKPGQIESLSTSVKPGEIKPGDTCLVPISEMAGLKTLFISNAGITPKGLGMLAKMTSLERLSLSDDLDEAAVAQIARIKSLRALSIRDLTHISAEVYSQMYSNGSGHFDPSMPIMPISAEILSTLATLPSLEELRVSILQPDAYAVLKKFASLKVLSLGGVGHGAENIRRLGQMQSLTHLDFQDLTDEELAALPDLPSLKVLTMDGEGYVYTAAGFSNLSCFTGLEALYVLGDINDATVAAIEPLTKLKILMFSGGFGSNGDRISDASLAHLSRFTSLECFHSMSGSFDAEGLLHLSKLPNLKELWIPNDFALTDAGMAQIGKCRRLEYLNIRAGKITDAGLAQLEGLSQLKELELCCNSTSKTTAIARLQRKIPGLTVTLGHRTKLPPVQKRIIHFPHDVSLGNLSILDEPDSFDPDRDWFWGSQSDATVQAKREVTVPEDARVQLTVVPGAFPSLSALADVEPNSVEAVVINCAGSEVKAGDKGIAAVANLPGLKALCLTEAGVTEAGLACLATMDSLERLDLTETELDDAAFAQIASIRTLKGLRVHRAAPLSPECLAELAALPALEEIHLPALQPEAYPRLKDLAAVRTLYLDRWPHGVKGVAQLGLMPNLQKLRFADLTDEELTALPDMPKLKSLEFIGEGYNYTSAGFANLSRFTALESLTIDGGFDDDACIALPQLPSLRALTLHTTGSGGAFAPDRITDITLAHISGFGSLEDLTISTGRFTNDGLARLANGPNLKKLSLPYLQGIGDAGVAQLAKIHTLEDLMFKPDDITSAGYRQLETLTSLRLLTVGISRTSRISDEDIAYLKSKISELTVVDQRKRFASAQKRVLKFPAGRSMGQLKTLSGEDNGYDNGWWCAAPKTDFAEAKGDVTVRADTRLGLAMSCDPGQDFSPLADLPSGAIEAIWVNCGDNPSKPGNAPLAAIAKMTSLKMLTLLNAGVTTEGISQLANLQSLERLSISEKELEDTALDTVARLRALRYLHIWRDYSLPGDRLCKLAKLPSLQYLSLCKMDLFACECLIRFPALQILHLDAGNGFVSVDYLDGLSNGGLNNAGLNNIHTLDIYDLTDEQFAALHEMPSVKKLSIQGKGYEYTAKGFASLSRLQQLESLKIYGRYRDDAVAAMPPLPNLKELCLGGQMQDRVDYLTDATLTHLAQFQSLESLTISIGQFTEEGLQHLAALPNLKLLWMPNNMALTDAGMEQLGKLSHLEQLNIRASKITDTGLMQLENVSSLRELRLFCRRESQITDETIARLQEKIPGLVIEE